METHENIKHRVLDLWVKSEYRERFFAEKDQDLESAKMNVIGFCVSRAIFKLDDLPAAGSVRVNLVWHWIEEFEGQQGRDDELGNLQGEDAGYSGT